MTGPIVIGALAIDALVGWPNWLYCRIGHPVGLFATVIDKAENAWNRADSKAWVRRVAGALLMAGLVMVAGCCARAAEVGARGLFGAWGWVVIALLAWPGLAMRSLYEHVRAVADALDEAGCDAGRVKVAMIVGRDTQRLDRGGVARAAIESLAESLCDAVAAPLFWLLLAGLPGIWIYKAVNTADSLIGHREPRWRAFGWAAARLDDWLNLVPARLAGCLVCLAGGRGAARALRVMWRDHGCHASPNAGWTEAAMAGVLDLRLAGPVVYDGVHHEKAWIGSGRSRADAPDIRRALRVYLRACLILAVGAIAVAFGC